MLEKLKNDQKQTFFITGSSGFLGREVVRDLLSRYKNSTFKFLINKKIPQGLKQSDRVIFVDKKLFDSNPKSVLENVDTVLHMAGKTHSHREKDYFDVNYFFTKKLVEVAKDSGVKKFIFVSTRALGKSCGDYGQSKALAEESIVQSGLPYIILRLAEVYGINSNEGISKMIKEVLTKRIVFYPNTKSLLAPVFLNDAVFAIVKSVGSVETLNKIYLIAGPNTYTILDFLKEVSMIVSKKVLFIPVPIFLIRGLALFSRFFKFGPVYYDQVDRLVCSKDFETFSAKNDLDFSPISLQNAPEQLFLQ